MSVIKLYEEFITRQQQVKTKFDTLKKKWWDSSAHLSRPEQLYGNKYYQEIIHLGNDVIPLLINDLDSPQGDWFNALNKITGENPINPNNKGISKKMTDDWKKWYGNIKENWFSGRDPLDIPNSLSYPFPIYLMNSFPNISHDNLSLTSPETKQYNCIAWVYGVTDRQMWPDSGYQYWPHEILNDDLNNKSFIGLFESIGYVICDNDSVESEYDKLVLFENSSYISHASKQLPDGKWHSKFGTGNDGIHTLEALKDGGYGSPKIFMKRKKGHPTENPKMYITENPKKNLVRKNQFGKVFRRNK